MRLIILFSCFIISNTIAWSQISNNNIQEFTFNQKWIYDNFKKQLSENNINVPREAVLKQMALILLCETNPCAIVLPVTGLHLEGKRLNNTQVELKFETFTEINNSGFVIERYFSQMPAYFDSVGFIKSAGNTLDKINYFFKDFNTNDQPSLYRIKQIDKDGRHQFSNIIHVKGYSSIQTITITPNPAHAGDIRIQTHGFKDYNNIRIVILSGNGSVVYNEEHHFLHTNSYPIKNLSLSKGIYHVTLYNNTERASTTLIRY